MLFWQGRESGNVMPSHVTALIRFAHLREGPALHVRVVVASHAESGDDCEPLSLSLS